jgi:glycosyltransferase involved in cell wall biosynthesis
MPAEHADHGEGLVILMPVYNDWESLQKLLFLLDMVLADHQLTAHVLVVDDASSVVPEDRLLSSPSFRAIERVTVLELRRNCGHQRAISVGLAYLEATTCYEAVVVMDADGEDDPADVPLLVKALEGHDWRRMAFAHRKRRSEGWGFSVCYYVYRKLFVTLVGQNVQFGNFSAVPRSLLRRLVCVSEIWNHYAIGALKAKIPFVAVPTRRATRLAGKTHMNFVSLVIHGLSAIAVYGDVIGVRALIVMAALGAPILVATSASILMPLVTGVVIPGWATYFLGISAILLLQFVTLALFFVFLTLNGRSTANVLPVRDYSYFVGSSRVVHPTND